MHNINELKYPEIIQELYQAHYLDAQRDNRQYSSHWKKYSDLCNVSIDLKGNIKAVGCGFGDFYYQRPWHKLVNIMTIASYLKSMSETEDLRYLMKSSEYILKKFSTYMSYDIFRNLCALAVIRRYLPFKKEDPFHVLNIGDGYGFLTAMIKILYPNSRIVLVDIGSTLLFQALNLQIAFPQSQHGLLSSEKMTEKDFIYCRAEKRELVRGRLFDLIINISSMMEMRMDVVQDYFSLIRKTALENNLFYCCNREKKVLPGGEVTEYSEYPWAKEDKILLDEAPEFYRYYYYHKYPFKVYFEPIRHRVVRMTISK